jgi:serine/threonine-protein kinase
MTGRTISHYEILERLGGGGMGEIFRARDTRLNRMVAIKVLPKSQSGDNTPRMRFMQEARAASGLSHPNIITVHDILADDGTDLLVMELVPGKTLGDLVPDTGLPVPQVLKYGVQIASALTAAHAAGIVHRDIKPGNIMVTGAGLVKVLDFGLAKPTLTGFGDDSSKTASISAPLTVQGTVVGTVNYMSPEQAEGKNVDGRSDIFSFGILLYEMVTGKCAFPGESMIATMSAILRDDVRPIREIVPAAPVQLNEIIEKCLKKNRDNRYQRMDEVLAALENLKLQYDTGSVATAVMATARPKSKAKWLIPAAIAAVLAIAGGVWFAVARWKTPPPAPPAVAVVEPPKQEAPPPAPVVQTPTVDPNAPLTNDSIVQMLDAKVSPALIVDQIRSSKTQFDLSTAELIRLTKAGAPDKVIQAMRDASKPSTARTVASAPSAPGPAKSGGVPLDASGANANSASNASSSSKGAATPPLATNPPIAPPASKGTPPAPADKLIAVSDALPFTILLSADIPTDAQAGAPLKFTVARDVLAGDVVIIPKGAVVSGQVVDEIKKKTLGVVGGAKMTYSLDQVDATGGQKLKVRATPQAGAAPNRRPVESGTNPGKKKPKDMAATAGTEFIGYIDGNQAVTVHK